MTPAMDVKGLEALARAYDREDSAQRGEPDPWTDTDGADDSQWQAERISCASAAISAYLAATLPPDVAGLVERLAKRAHKWRGNDDGAFVGIKLGDLRSVITALTALSAREAKMREALEPFVEAFERRRNEYSRRHQDGALGYANFDKMPDDWLMEKISFNMGVFRRARLASDQTGAEA